MYLSQIENVIHKCRALLLGILLPRKTRLAIDADYYNRNPLVQSGQCHNCDYVICTRWGCQKSPQQSISLNQTTIVVISYAFMRLKYFWGTLGQVFIAEFNIWIFFQILITIYIKTFIYTNAVITLFIQFVLLTISSQ